jgi:hypothetical protein
MPTPEIEAMKDAVRNADPFSIQNLIPTLWAAAVAALGGAANFYQKVKAGKTRAFNVMELAGEIIVSAFVGLVTFWICKGYGVNEWLTAAAVAVTGHMGSRAIFLAEQWIETKLK